MSGILVHPTAKLGSDFKPAPFSIVDENVVVGDGVAVGSFVHLHSGAVIGAGTSIGDRVTIGEGAHVGSGCVIGDNVSVAARCRIGDRVELWNGAIVENDTDIGDRTCVQAGAYLTAHVVVEEDCFIGPMVVTTNDNFMGRTPERFKHLKGCTLRRASRIGGGSHILPGVEIGEEAVVAAGSVVTSDVEPGKLVMGSPARVVKDAPQEQRLDAS